MENHCVFWPYFAMKYHQLLTWRVQLWLFGKGMYVSNGRKCITCISLEKDQWFLPFFQCWKEPINVLSKAFPLPIMVKPMGFARLTYLQPIPKSCEHEAIERLGYTGGICCGYERKCVGSKGENRHCNARGD
jgi:hypothetical protein